MSFDGSEYLVIIDYYSKMPIVQKMPTSQCTAARTITHLKELLAEHGLPESIRSDNRPQLSSHLFKEFAEEWNFTHHISSLKNPHSNGQAESAVKIIKGLLTWLKYAGEDPYFALLAYRSTPVDSHLRSPGEMLYQCALCTTVPQRIKHQDPHAAAECECESAAKHDCTGCHKKAPLYAGQTVSVLNNDRMLWLPATVVHTATHGSYIVKVIGGAEYRWAWDHICEHHPDAVKPDMHPKVEAAEHPVSTPSAAAKQAVPLQLWKHPLLPQHNHLLLPQQPGKLQPKALQQQPAPSGRHLHVQM